MPYSNFAGLTLVTPPSAQPISVADARAHSRIFHHVDDALIAGYIAGGTTVCEDRCRRAFMPQTWRLALEQFPGRSPALGYREGGVAEYYRWNKIDIPKPPLISVVSFTYTDSGGTVNTMVQNGFGNQVGNYLVDLETEPGRIVLPFAGIWPTTVLLPGSPILITYNCGYPAYSGTINIDAQGAATFVSGSNFTPSLVGTWITIQGTGDTFPASLAVQSCSDATHLTLTVPSPSPIILPSTAAVWTGNAVPMPLRCAVLFMAAHLYENREPIITGRSETAIEIPNTIDALLAQYEIFRT